MPNSIHITDEELKKSAVTYRKDLLVMPVLSASDTLQHMTPRPGVAGREVLGQLSGNIELGPYDPKRYDDEDLEAKPRVLETFLGSVIKRFDPNSVAKTVYGSLMTQGEELKNVDIAQQVLYFLSAKLGQGLNQVIWNAKRNDSGTTTKELFNGFDTITEAEITAQTIKASEGNFVQLSEAIDETNAADILMSIYEKADDNLRAVPTKFYIPFEVYTAYNRDYLTTFGAVAYNREFKKIYLEGSNNLCELVPLASKKGSKFLHLSTQGNMVYGYGDGLADEKATVEKFHEFLLSYVATMYFGCQFESVSKERLLVAKLSA